MTKFRDVSSKKWLIFILLLQACSSEPPSASTSNTEEQWLDSIVVAADPADSSYPLNPIEFSTQLAARSTRFSIRGIFTVSDSLPTDITNENQSALLAKAGLIASLDRVAARSKDDVAAQPSQWHYEHVLRSSVVVDAVANRTPLFDQLASIKPTSSVQRAALKLAGASDHQLWVGNNSLNIESIVDSPPNQCSARYRWQSEVSATLRVQLEFLVQSCPQTQSVGDYTRWQLGGLAASGSLDELENSTVVRSTPIDATVWFSHGWGEVPNVGGAVVLDTLSIEIGSQQRLDISRSRRRSGRGPETVEASLLDRNGGSRTIDIVWKDEEALATAASGTRYPNQITLSSVAENIDLSVYIMNRAIESDTGFGKSLNVPVIVSGSHTGSGFLNYVSINSTSP